MPIDRRSLMAAPLVLGLASLAKAQTPVPEVPGGALPPGLPQPSETIDLWPKGAPGAPAKPLVETVQERSTDRLVTDRAVFGITRPRMAVFRPDRPNGAAVLITPGGGYRWVVVDKEGYEMGRWLAARGFTAFVLFYRLPGEGWAAGPDVALADAQRAMRLIRHRARDFAVDPERVSAMGFSAGGHLCADLSTRFDAKAYEPVDAADALSARPHSAAPIYPVIGCRGRRRLRRGCFGLRLGLGPGLVRAARYLQIAHSRFRIALTGSSSQLKKLCRSRMMFALSVMPGCTG
ncbi:alpha/beta hydrolase [Blastomonas sp. UPD001]|uniref:alpha/beta hydrolase n=1 Tax=Blastomonas sp. UPD001 TaxID=2217673 RepID=UPI001E35A3CF|nr:alpha/beta hydrolase [Blastomonas sp. UPD001]